MAAASPLPPALTLEAQLWLGVSHASLEWRNPEPAVDERWHDLAGLAGGGLGLRWAASDRLDLLLRHTAWASATEITDSAHGYTFTATTPYGGDFMAMLAWSLLPGVSIELGAGISGTRLELTTAYQETPRLDSSHTAQGVVYGAGLLGRLDDSWAVHFDLRLLRLERLYWDDGQELELDLWSTRWGIQYLW
ncbi:hypothetical protein CKO15_02615 [Halorhodospira abdelmalekii]|uniref:outer membrane protein n=1 Tax=Halorhodospira abdelmalekii TaxID=421629 RepID=UPI0019083CFF|nr:hypothetical protein [Halorhodospira abdelmalekii]MBK1734192.1 hypothetical protein [Halorhodospira abdelmalekii]